MIRRGFWLAVGAAGGIMAYRRVAEFGHRASGTLGAGRTRVTTLTMARETIRFTSDVREGMDLYMARHPRQPGPTLGANKVPARGDDPPEPPGRVPDGGNRHRIGRAHNENVKDDR